MERILAFTISLTVLFACSNLLAQESKRLALVIGNASYEHGGVLKNPVNDAELMSATLKSLNFEVIKLTNASLKDMQNGFKSFASKLGSYDVALYFYAGHGIQVNGENYLIPVDAQLEDKMSLEYEAFEVSDVNKYFSYHPDKMNIMILDACRNNPYRSWMRGGGEGFAAVKQQGAGTIIAFATREGETASDGIGDNGLFTYHLAEQMRIPQNITDVFQNTRIAVLKESGNQQVPQEWNMLTGNFYFTNTNIEKPKIDTYATPDLEIVERTAAFTLTDNRDGKKYRLVEMGKQTWLAENLNYTSPSGSWVYDDKPANAETYGRLYDWHTAKNVCPTRWHLPSDAEWTILVNYLGGRRAAGNKLREAGGFSGLPGGVYYIRTFLGFGKTGYWWSSTERNRGNALFRRLNYNRSSTSSSNFNKSSGLSVRCLKDN